VRTLDRRHFLRTSAKAAVALSGGAGLLAAARACAARGEAAARKLNFVFILIDDLGWTDVGCYGSRFYETPAVDRLAKMGVRFTNGYAACTVCSPTRVSILTGKYPARVHLTDWISGHKRPRAKLRVPDWTMYMKKEEVTLAEALKPGGYATGFIGKWHLGPREEYWPKSQGFDVNIGGYSRGAPPSYFAPYRIPTMADGPKGEYLTDRHAADAETFLEAHKDRPFLLYLSMYAVHTPLQAKKELIARYQAKADADPTSLQRHPVYGGMVHSMDECVGRVIRKLEELKLLDRTAIFFTGDNGGLIGNPRRPITSNAPLRAGKGSSYEGGVREPFVVYVPGVTKPGSVCGEPVISIDFYPTILELAGVPGDAKHNRRVDGVSLVPILRGATKLDRDAVYWHYPHYHPGGATPYGAIRQRDWKLIEFFEDMHVELYNLREDIGEKNDLAPKMPDKAAELRGKLHEWRRAVDAQMPAPNPNYDPSRATQRGGGRGKRAAGRRDVQHPDFAICRGGTVKKTASGYDLETRGEGTALKRAAKPFTRRAVFELRMQTRRRREEGWQNGFLAIGDSGKDGELICAGLYIGGQNVAVFEGLSDSDRKTSTPATFDRQKPIDVKVVVDLVKRSIQVSAAGATASRALPQSLRAVRYYGYHAMQTKTSFGEVRVTGQ